MENEVKDAFLAGQLLVAMPSIGDGRFAQSVIFLWSHDAEGAMGLIVNKPISGLRLSDIVSQVGVDDLDPAHDMDVHTGGPVERQRGFLLHSAEYASKDTQNNDSGTFALTATIDALKDVASGSGPAQSMLALGYSGWDAGQLERELQENAWLIAPATPELVFMEDKGQLWETALATLGVDPRLLSAIGGQA
jgi:putative transcriptional regulator